MARWFEFSTDGKDAFLAFMKEPRGGGLSEDIVGNVQDIIAKVRTDGAGAVVDYTTRFDGVELDPETLQAPSIDLERLAASCPQEVKDSLDFAARRILNYHSAQLPEDHSFDDGAGNVLGWRWGPIDAVGLYVPGGRASYPSSVLMNAIPAKAAGVSRMVMVAPAPQGELSSAVAYAALACGIDEYYPIGGAQAVAALAYGAGPIRAVDKIVGPGNAYVAAAKRLVFGDVGIDTIAGPSEICVVADPIISPELVAIDLLSQAEHDPAAQSILITSDIQFAKAVEASISKRLESLETKAVASISWTEHGAIVIAPRHQYAQLVDIIAPEHVELVSEDADQLGDEIRHAGAIFYGSWAPEALGDYVTGSNHVLPTNGAARFASGLSVYDFMKRTSIQKISRSGYQHLAGAAEALASAEGLEAHRLSVALRRDLEGGSDGKH